MAWLVKKLAFIQIRHRSALFSFVIKYKIKPPKSSWAAIMTCVQDFPKKSNVKGAPVLFIAFSINFNALVMYEHAKRRDTP